MVKELPWLQTKKATTSMTMRLYDTARQEIVDLELGDHVRMYVCGITPYDSTHLGHAATYLTYDLLFEDSKTSDIPLNLSGISPTSTTAS